MTTTVYVLRAFGGVLIVQSTQQVPEPTVLIAAYARDGIVKTSAHDGIAVTSTRDGFIVASARDGIAKTTTRDGITPARTP